MNYRMTFFHICNAHKKLREYERLLNMKCTLVREKFHKHFFTKSVLKEVSVCKY